MIDAPDRFRTPPEGFTIELARYWGEIAEDSSATNDHASSPGPDSVWSGLLRRVRGRDPEAWRWLTRLFGPLVYGWCRQSGLQAADVAQETFRAVFAAVEDFRRTGKEDSFRGWLWTITRNKIRDHFRSHQRMPRARGGTDAQQQLLQIPEHEPASSTTQPSTTGGGSLVHRGLGLVRLEFENHTWQAFWRTTVDQQRAAEVADEPDMTRAAVYKAKSRIMRRIRQELGDLMEG